MCDSYVTQRPPTALTAHSVSLNAPSAREAEWTPHMATQKIQKDLSVGKLLEYILPVLGHL